MEEVKDNFYVPSLNVQTHQLKQRIKNNRFVYRQKEATL